ncbi:hypothetical protein D9619_001188 [Psilocybe cf. subviscida]|uniref:BTB domain-containing protein n=1 Tax=Psilocybe cf. subviscida TaxID=2480587 RepID=A0A8H5BED8_9AGAR|nr:hypothetical protein D9619_001188 [Psilocybe cf. subviscida]
MAHSTSQSLVQTTQTQNPALWVSAPDECDIRAGKTLYRLELGVLAKISVFFGNLNRQAVQQEGEIVVISEFNEPEFEYYAYVAYSLPIKAGFKDLDKYVLVRALQLSKFLISPLLRDTALNHIRARRYEFSLAEIFKICRDLPTRQFVEYAFRRLLELQPRWSLLPADDIQTVGFPVMVAAVQVRDGIETHRRLVAGEPPILTHAPTCTDTTRCTDDWVQIWWNIIGRYLLEAREDVSWDQAVEKLLQCDFGAMDRLCLQSALDIVKGGDPMLAESRFISNATEQVMKLFGEAETWEI